jgi:hypothetical protein
MIKNIPSNPSNVFPIIPSRICDGDDTTLQLNLLLLIEITIIKINIRYEKIRRGNRS